MLSFRYRRAHGQIFVRTLRCQALEQYRNLNLGETNEFLFLLGFHTNLKFLSHANLILQMTCG